MTPEKRQRRRYKYLSDEEYRRTFRVEELPPLPWTYTLTPTLVQNLMRVADAAGQLRAAPLSYYRQKELAAQAKRMRIAWSSGRVATLEEIDVVLRGARLPERRASLEEPILRAALAEDALEHFTANGTNDRRLTPEIAMVYRACSGGGDPPGIPPLKRGRFGRPSWSLYGPRERAKLLDTARSTVTVPPQVKEIFDWANHDELVSKVPVLRAATIFWGLTLVDSTWKQVSIVLHHELRVGRVDPNGVLMLTEATVAQHELLSTPASRMVRADQGDLTKYFEEFTWSLSLVLEEVCERLGLIHGNERFLPWKVAAPTDNLDVKLHDAVERLGKAGSAAIVEALGEGAPPLRTVQRRLARLVSDGVLVKRGARKNAIYSLVAPVEG